MRNKRLNVLFIAVIALAAAPQALEDARRLAHEAHQWAETEFWSVFLSRQTPGPVKRASSPQMLADAGMSAKTEACPLGRVMAGMASNGSRRAVEKSTAQQSTARTWRFESAEVDQNFTFTFDEQARADAGPNNVVAHPKAFYENDKMALRLAGLHAARDAEKFTEAAMKASLASLSQSNQRTGARIRRAQDVERQLRQKVRFTRDKDRSETETPEPDDAGSM